MNKNTQNTNIDKLLKQAQIPREIMEIDVDAEWQHFTHKAKVKHFKPRKTLNLYRISAIAASIIIIFALYLNFFAFTTITTKNVQKIILNDKSTVTLSKGSTLKISKLYGIFNRKVKLNGVAFFEITHNSLKPFIVRTKRFNIKVLGTKFLVSTPKKQVSVTQGIVQVKTFKHKTLLTKGQQAKITKNQIITTSFSTKRPILQTGKISFDSTSLEQVAQSLSLIYAQPVHVSDNIKNYKLTATFENQQLDTVLSIIARALDIKVVRENGQYLLTK